MRWFLPLLAGCVYITDEHYDGRIDSDGDGLPFDKDCDEGDPGVGAPATWYGDGDGDGYTVPDDVDEACEQPEGYAAVASEQPDCDDAAADVHPGAEEICGNERDDDCDGLPGDCGLVGESSTDRAATRWVGEAVGDVAGMAVAFLGDTDADGFPDAAVGSVQAETDDVSGGAAWLVMGPQEGRWSLAAIPTRLSGNATGAQASTSLSGAGDLDGDGYDDFLVGAPGAPGEYTDYGGAAYLFFGPVSGATKLPDADLVVDSVTEASGLGQAVSQAGNTGLDPGVWVGAPQAEVDSQRAGAAWLVPSDATSWSSVAATINGEAAYDAFGYTVVGGGDLDGDGVDDVAVGAPGNDDGAATAGAVYLLVGRLAGTYAGADAERRYYGQQEGGTAGMSLAFVGDADGDGADDVLVGQPQVGSGGAGQAWLLTWADGDGAGPLDAARVRIDGDADGAFAGYSVAGAGDTNGDGVRELAVGVPRPGGEGSVWLFPGTVEGVVGRPDAAAVLVGEADADLTGWSVAGGADWDLDGNDDILVGAPYSGFGGPEAGAAYLVLGEGGL